MDRTIDRATMNCSDNPCGCNKWYECKIKWELVARQSQSICCPSCNLYRYYNCNRITQSRPVGIETISNILYQKLKKPEEQVKIIFFIGAGCSVSCGIPASRDIKEKFIELIKSSPYVGRFKTIINELINELNRTSGNIPAVTKAINKIFSKISTINDLYNEEVTLEFVLAVASRMMGNERIVEKLSEIFPDRYSSKPTNIGYEYLAHLAKYKLVDAIVSMNYDEMLEKALDDEIGEDGVFQIVSDVDFDRAKYLESKGFLKEKFKIYKPHGTISAKHLMKFEIKDVVMLSPIKYTYLKDLLKDPDTIIIFIGYRNNDIDMNQLLFEIAQEKGIRASNRIYWVLRSTTCPYFYSSDITNIDITNIINSGIYGILHNSRSLSNRIVYPPNSEVFDEFLCDIINELNKIVEEKDKINNFFFLTRHKIRHLLFSNKLLPQNFKNKFILETLIYALKAKGCFNISALFDCPRIRNYSDRLNEENVNAKSLIEMLEKNNVLTKINDKIVIAGDNIDEVLDKITLVFKETNPSFNMDDDTKNKFKDLLIHLIRDFDIDISTTYNRENDICFTSPTPIKNFLELNATTRDIIVEESKKDNGEIRIITENGDWLAKNDYTNKIVSDFKNKDCFKVLIPYRTLKYSSLFTNIRGGDGENELKKIGVTNIRWIVPEKHEEHMTIGSNKALYFVRKGRSTSISPVIVKDEKDIKALTTKFDDLWKEGINIELKNFWLPFIQEGGIVIIGAREMDVKSLASRGISKRNVIGTKDFDAYSFIFAFLSKFTTMEHKIMPYSEQEEVLLDKDKNYIMIGGPDINKFTEKAWLLLLSNNHKEEEPVESGFVFYEDPKKMKEEKIESKFYETATNNKIGIMDRSEGKFYEFSDSNDLGVVIKAPHPLNDQKTILIIAGFSGYGTKNSALWLTSNEVWKEIAKLNESYGNSGVEVLLSINKKGDIKDIKIVAGPRSVTRYIIGKNDKKVGPYF